MMTKKFFCLSLSILLFLSLFSAQVLAENSAKQQIFWSNWSAGAKAIALGRSQSAIESQGEAIFLNPAGISSDGENYLTFMHIQLPNEVSYDLAAINNHWNGIGWGVGYQKLIVEGISGYDQMGNFLGFFNDREQVLSLGISNQVKSELSLGVAVRFFHQELSNKTGFGYGIDLGAKWQPAENLTVGTVLTNPIGQMNWSTDEVEQFTQSVRIGFLYDFPELDFRLTGEYLTDSGDTPFHFGMEKGYLETLRFRVGMDGLKPTLGLGIIMNSLVVNYALVLDYDLGKHQYLSLNWKY